MSHGLYRTRQVTKRFGAVTAVDRLDLDDRTRASASRCWGPRAAARRPRCGWSPASRTWTRARSASATSCSRRGSKNFYLPPEQRNFGMVFQAFAVWPHLSVFDNVAFPLRVRKLPTAEIEARTDGGAAAHQPLRGGEGQPRTTCRAAASSAWRSPARSRSVPTSCCSTSRCRRSIRTSARRCASRSRTCSGGSASRSSTSRTTRRRRWRCPTGILVMRAGVVQQVGTPLEVYRAPANRFVFEFIGLSSFLRVGARRRRHARRRGERAVAGDRAAAARARRRGRGGPRRAARPRSSSPPPAACAAWSRARRILGETIDYRIAVGDVEVRVQKSRHARPARRSARPAGSLFPRPRWYPQD